MDTPSTSNEAEEEYSDQEAPDHYNSNDNNQDSLSESSLASEDEQDEIGSGGQNNNSKKLRNANNNHVGDSKNNNNNDVIAQLFQKGIQSQDAGEYSEALIHFNSILQVDGNHRDALFYKGAILVDVIGNYETALECLDIVLENLEADIYEGKLSIQSSETGSLDLNLR